MTRHAASRSRACDFTARAALFAAAAWIADWKERTSTAGASAVSLPKAGTGGAVVADSEMQGGLGGGGALTSGGGLNGGVGGLNVGGGGFKGGVGGLDIGVGGFNVGDDGFAGGDGDFMPCRRLWTSAGMSSAATGANCVFACD